MLVNPLGHEYIRNHRAFRILADRLAFKGFTVLRFDFLGTGDSWGNLEDVGFADWLEDLHLARAALATEIGDGTVSLVGRRLGAALALLAETSQGSGAGKDPRGLDLTRSVLWDPVLEGGPYLRGIEGIHREYFGMQSHRGNVAPEEDTRSADPSPVQEILGMMLPLTLATEIEQLDVQQAYSACGSGTMMLDSHPSGELLHEPGTATLRRVDDPWESDDPLRVFVPMHILQMITEWIAE
jgi:pimeloyl-ACP methyl ester carboxylesterase